MSIRDSYSAFTSKIVIIEKHKNTVEKLTSLPYDLQSKKYAKIGGTPRMRGPAGGGGWGGSARELKILLLPKTLRKQGKAGCFRLA